MRTDNTYKTQLVKIGNVLIGGSNPVVIQSMTNTNTGDTIATVEQIIRIVKAGASIVRISVPTVKDAENLKNIKKCLNEKGYNTPLVADIHFNHKIAEVSAKIVEKIRINPGNFANNKHSLESSFENELDNIKQYFIPLIRICKKYNTAIRIGVNHGSLSKRIIAKYGDTPEGMVESAMEYIRICKDEDFHNIVLSLKSSNTRTMIYANRMLMKKMKQSGIVYPLHIGVTEAGAGNDAILKSAVGIGALLSGGIGDTIRVSLTGSPEKEIPVAYKIVEFSDKKGFDSSMELVTGYKKRKTIAVGDIGADNKFSAIIDYCKEFVSNKNNTDDFIFIGNSTQLPDIMPDFKFISTHKNCNNKRILPVFGYKEYLQAPFKSGVVNFVEIPVNDFSQNHINNLKDKTNIVVILSSDEQDNINQYYRCFGLAERNGFQLPVIIKRKYSSYQYSDILIRSAVEAGRLIADGLGEGLWLSAGVDNMAELTYGLLQACGVRFTKPEYISCPTCSRTMFDIERVCAEIKKRTTKIKNIKIAVMGCIVNGPGEMADADYGYVGAGKNKVTIYKGKEIIKRNVPQEKAIDELINIIKENGDYKE